MNAQAYAAVRTLVQFVMAWLVAHVTVFAAVPAAERSAIAETLVSAVCVGLWTFGVRWLETRQGDGFWPSTARLAGRLLMLGLGKQPVYPIDKPAGPPTAVYSASTATIHATLPQ